MDKKCINPECKKDIAEDSIFCGYCRTKQNVKKEEMPSFFADEYDVIEESDPILITKREKVSLESLLSILQEAIREKHYPFSAGIYRQLWWSQAERGKTQEGKPRIVIKHTDKEKWGKVKIIIAVDQLGDDITIKLSFFRKNEIAAYYYNLLGMAGAFTSYGDIADDSIKYTGTIQYKVDWAHELYYKPPIKEVINFLSKKIEGIYSSKNLETATDIAKLQESGKLRAYIEFMKTKSIEIFRSYPSQIIKYNQNIEAIVRKFNISGDAAFTKAISKATKKLWVINEFKPFLIIGAVLFFLFVLGKSGSFMLALPAGAGAVIIFFVVRSAANKKFEALKNAYEEILQLGKKIEEERAQFTDLVAGNLEWLFENIEREEQKLRQEASFAEEELEQLMSVVENLFKQITAKWSSKKETKNINLQTSVGLGGMGFDE